LKAAIAHRLMQNYSDRLPVVLIRRALDDAEDLADETGFPQLFLPALAEEKVSLLSRFLTGSAELPVPLERKAARSAANSSLI
jgi:hypothetical protein